MTAETTADAAPSAATHASIGVLGAASLVAGSMVGSGVYLLPATLGAIGSISILGWLAAGLAALAIAGVFIQLAPLAPQARGVPAYIQAGLGPAFGVQSAVLYWCSIWFGLVPLSLAAAGALGFVFPALDPPGVRLALTVAIIWLGIAAAWAGPRIVARVEGWTLLIGLAPVILTATIGWFAFRPEVFVASWNPQDLSLLAAAKASGLNCFWAFLGIECAAAAASVVRDPVRNVPRATVLGVVGVMAIYVAVTVVMMGLLPHDRLASSNAPFADAAHLAMGAGAGVAIAACMALRASGCLTGWMLVASETTRTAADAGDFPALFRSRSGERMSLAGLLAPGVLMTVEAVLSAQPNLAQQFSTLTNVTSLLCLYTYLMAAVSLMRVAGRGRPMAIATAGVAVLATLGLIGSAKPLELGLSLLPLAAAGLLYLWLRRR
ncbi:MAG TPA: amino acid permease [Phenylobacterium sp.]